MEVSNIRRSAMLVVALACAGVSQACEIESLPADASDGSASGSDAGGDGADAAPCECTGPRPLAPNQRCSDGSLAGPVCATHSDGSCAWEVRSCPAQCPALGCFPQCPNGVLTDSNGCPTCSCAPAPEDAGATGLHWYRTCGSPVCGIEPADPLPSTCGSNKEGDACSEENATCDPGYGCGVKLRCASAPINTRNCPISSRAYKTDINYLAPADLERLARSVQHIKLATYDYKGQPPEQQKHLGFIIEDDPQSPAVFMSRDRVDLYGYASMAVAALQVQEQRIQQLERELVQLRAQLGANDAPLCEGER